MATTTVETPSYLRYERVAGPPPPATFSWPRHPLVARWPQSDNECWAIAALQMMQDRSELRGKSCLRLRTLTPDQVRDESIRVLASHYDQLHGLPPGTVASQQSGGILAMALTWLEMSWFAAEDSSCTLTSPRLAHLENVANIQRSIVRDGPVAVTFDRDSSGGGGIIHSICLVGWTGKDWLVRDSTSNAEPLTRLPLSTYLVAFGIQPRRCDEGPTPFSGSSGLADAPEPSRRGRSAVEWWHAQPCSVQSGISAAIVIGIVALGIGIGLLIWYLDKVAP